MKKLVLVVCCLALATAGLFANGGKESGGGSGSGGKIEVSIIMKSRGSPYFTALTNSVKDGCEKLGWTVSIYDSNEDSVKETENIEAAISKRVKLIFLDNYESLSVVPLINRATEAGIPVIAIDSGVGPGAKFVTTVYSNNIENGRAVGLSYINLVGKDKPLIGILLSGSKGNPVGEERRTGLFTGILQARLGLSPEAALAAGKEFNRELTTNGRARHEQAKFEVRGQGWGEWSRDGGRNAADDLIVANKDLNLMMGENDEMNLGAMGALEVAGLLGKVDIIAAADGSKAAYDLMLNNPDSKYIATGENSPSLVGVKAVSIAKEILIDGKDPYSYPAISMTEAVAVTKENARARYDYGF